MEGERADRILEAANSKADKIKHVLSPIAWEDRPYVLLVHVTDEALAVRFQDAVSPANPKSYAARTASDRSPSWMLLSDRQEDGLDWEIRNGLIWNCLYHLPLPRWLRAGIATHLWRTFDSGPGFPPREVFNTELIPEHRRFWNEVTIQSFWAGTCGTEHPEQSNLAGELSNILVHLLGEKTKSLVDYLQCANEYDGGQSAARACLKTDLGELAGTFLGPGHWTPDSVAIAECWDRSYEGETAEE